MLSSNALSSSTLPCLATRVAMDVTGVDITISCELRIPCSCRRRNLQRLDELSGNWMVRSWILTSDEFAIDNHVRREIDRAGGHLAASRAERIRHVEVHLRVKNLVLDPLLFGS